VDLRGCGCCRAPYFKTRDGWSLCCGPSAARTLPFSSLFPLLDRGEGVPDEAVDQALLHDVLHGLRMGDVSVSSLCVDDSWDTWRSSATWLSWQLTLQRHGLPESQSLGMSGRHLFSLCAFLLLYLSYIAKELASLQPETRHSGSQDGILQDCKVSGQSEHPSGCCARASCARRSGRLGLLGRVGWATVTWS
jgi:hypothetical protein